MCIISVISEIFLRYSGPWG